MPSTYTLNNGIELIGTGEQSGTWGDTTNTNLSLLDTALDGQVTVTLPSAGTSGSPNTLAITDGAASDGRNRMVTFADGGDLGATAFVQLTPNDSEKIIYVRNTLAGSRSIILFQGTYNASNDYEVPAGTTAVVYFDGAGSGAVAANVFNNAHFDALNVVGNVTVGGDVTVTGTVDAGTVEFDNLSGTGAVSVTNILDEDNMASDSATALSTQQSIKAYVDAQVGANNELSEVLANGNTTGGNNILFGDNDKAIFGAGSDLQIYFNGADGVINESVAGNLLIQGDNIYLQNSAASVSYLRGVDGGAVDLRYAGNVKLATTSTGIDVTGTAVMDGLTVDGASDSTPAVTISANNNALGTKNTLRFFDDDGAVDNGQQVGRIEFYTDDNTNTGVNAYFEVTNNTTGYGTMSFATGTSASLAERMSIGGTGDITFYDTSGNASFVYDENAGSTFNEQGADRDFRVESNSNANMLFVDAGNNLVSVGQGTPSTLAAGSSTLGDFTVSSTVYPVAVFERDMAAGTSGDYTAQAIVGKTTGTPTNSLTIGHRFAINNSLIGEITSSYGGQMSFKTATIGNSYVEKLVLGSAEAVFNEDSNNLDFRVESDNQTHMLFVDAGNNTVGIGNSSPTEAGLVVDTIGTDANTSAKLALKSSETSVDTYLRFGRFGTGDDASFTIANNFYRTSSGYVADDTSWGPTSIYFGDGEMSFGTVSGAAAPLQRMIIKGSEIVANEQSYNQDFRVESDGSSNMLFVDAENNRIGINYSSPATIMHIRGGDPDLTIEATSTSGTTLGDKNNRILMSANSTTGGNGGEIVWLTSDDGNRRWAAISGSIATNTGSTASGGLIFATKPASDSALTSRLYMNGGTEAVFNDASSDYDFRVESDANAYMIFANAGLSEVGINTTITNAAFAVQKVDSASPTLRLYGDNTNSVTAEIRFQALDSGGTNRYADIVFDPDISTGAIQFYTDYGYSTADKALQLDAANGAIFNDGGSSTRDFRVETDSVSEAFVVDAGANNVRAMGTKFLNSVSAYRISTGTQNRNIKVHELGGEYYLKLYIVGLRSYTGSEYFTRVVEITGMGTDQLVTVISNNQYGAGLAVTVTATTPSSGVVNLLVDTGGTNYRFTANVQMVHGGNGAYVTIDGTDG